MRKLKQKINKDTILNELEYTAFSILNEPNYIVNGNGFKIQSNGTVAHLLHIHNSNVEIANLSFIGGNTSIIRNIRAEDIKFSNPKSSVFEIIDGGAVLITGKSKVFFKNCIFKENNALMCGGAVSNQSKDDVVFNNCHFENNTAGHSGSAIDNLTINSSIEVVNCQFINNRSNVWNKSGAPHGQISVFPYTYARIVNSEFRKGSIPYDFYESSILETESIKYLDDLEWYDLIIIKRHFSPFSKLQLLKKLFWLPFKTKNRVYYRVNK